MVHRRAVFHTGPPPSVPAKQSRNPSTSLDRGRQTFFLPQRVLRELGWRTFPKRTLAGVCFQRDWPLRSLRDCLSGSQREVASFLQRCYHATLAERWPRTLLLSDRWDFDGRGGHRRKGFLHAYIYQATFRQAGISGRHIIDLGCLPRRTAFRHGSYQARRHPRAADVGYKLASGAEEVSPAAKSTITQRTYFGLALGSLPEITNNPEAN